ncbi:cyclic peptide export ABC transporter [Shumkonia mesophila]|uniref:cyclic peptide export ABC transporter n=1 Tax=Shumkonia mesophila TaxID=2838854 RepID=UPI00293435D3|nr:cyclic peptide export ABC transporter [Shumkonia mesophila]
MAMREFIRRAPARDIRTMLALALIAGLANAFLIVVVNEVTGEIAEGGRPGVVAWVGFALAFGLFYQCNNVALLRANVVIERLLKGLRTDVMDKLRRSELQTVDRLGRGGLYTLVSQETNHLSVTFPLMVSGAQQAILLAMSLFYLAYLSPAALGVFLLAVLLGYVGYRMVSKGLRAAMAVIQERQARMLDSIGDIIHGGKELRLNQRKSDDVFALYRDMSQSVEGQLISAGEIWSALLLMGAFVTYLMLGVVGFVFPAKLPNFNQIVFQVVPVLLFCMGPLTKLVAQSPMYLRADVGLQSILDIDRQLLEAGGVSTQEARDLSKTYADFRTLSFDRLRFSYRDAQGARTFTVGPLDLAVTRGETVFLVGGNGSGKSTVLRLVVGLLPAEGGSILVDGAPVEGRAVAGYRELFSAIFVDFHLFDRLYGLEGVSPVTVNRMIEEMELGGKVRYENGRFTQLALSTGQRKRLGLIAALLEDRAVYVFDEWSAEQDIRFREYFYTRVLPDLKARGKTVIAVTHDDRYWHVADRLVKMDLGRVEWERSGGDHAN